MTTPIIQTLKNDYNHTCNPIVLRALTHTCDYNYNGYGLDDISKNVENIIRELCCCQSADVHFLVGGTMTNLLTISAFLRPHQAIIAVESGHIAVHETGAIEATGHKIITAASNDGKLKPEQIQALCAEHDNEHMVQAKLVYISQSTELGTVYTKSELAEISKTCKKLDLFLFVDGARLGTALTCECDVPSLSDMAKLCDAFYIGGTKNGAMFGEALVLIRDDIKKDFRYLCKQRGAMLAKGWLVSVQFEALFNNNLYYDLANNANLSARYIYNALKKMGIPFLLPTITNQIFPIVSPKTADSLSALYAFETWSKTDKEHVIRFVTSWNTTEKDGVGLISAFRSII